MTNRTNNSEDMLKKRSRRNWLSNAAIMATGALLLMSILTGCTKEVPGGGVGGGSDSWYNLRAFYQFDPKTTADTVYLAQENDWHGDPDWYWIKVTTYKSNATKFKLHRADAGNGWQWLETNDGYWLSMTFSGSVYLSGFGNKVAWKIINGKLYTNYAVWNDYPLSAQYYTGFNSPAYYVGVNWRGQYLLTGCELVPAQ